MEPRRLAKLLNFEALGGHLQRLDKELKSLNPPPALSLPVKNLMGGGKRLRPVLVIAGAAAGGGRISAKVLRAAAAAELVHLASLAHDDVIDRAGSRRGRSAANPELAILTGDWLLAQAGAAAAAVSPEASLLIAGTISQMAAGQADQLKLNPPYDFRSWNYTSIISQKTASLMSASARLGGLGAGLQEDKANALAGFGQDLGVAYQIIDDITDGDIRTQDTAAAEKLAREFCVSAAEQLSGLPDSPIKKGLTGLPESYLNWALGR